MRFNRVEIFVWSLSVVDSIVFLIGAMYYVAGLSDINANITLIVAGSYPRTPDSYKTEYSLQSVSSNGHSFSEECTP